MYMIQKYNKIFVLVVEEKSSFAHRSLTKDEDILLWMRKCFELLQTSKRKNMLWKVLVFYCPKLFTVSEVKYTKSDKGKSNLITWIAILIWM